MKILALETSAKSVSVAVTEGGKVLASSYQNIGLTHSVTLMPLLDGMLQNAGLTLSGLSPDGRLVETVELSDRPFYVGVQYHPEFKSRPDKPHPLFKGFLAAALEKQQEL